MGREGRRGREGRWEGSQRRIEENGQERPRETGRAIGEDRWSVQEDKGEQIENWTVKDSEVKGRAKNEERDREKGRGRRQGKSGRTGERGRRWEMSQGPLADKTGGVWRGSEVASG